ncbi:xylulokinase [Shewanella schlegeliana]|uniref:Xylulose kinase n=1 Tax=Shewanella schlegeliana TaxID=190308 RepID=A0ABS1SXS9_9GAMM|nr:xylulokinase [Shewanella schlegeliana]MBL4912096.1 xylulokinase [Shewanella schlegeliana]MCL1111306.1 xylulokinase [Shewanella schlegeliana]GIU32952.1 xylulokinase [Shewanella schlegeliana]
MSIVAGVDCGTQGTKVILVDINTSAVLAECSAPHELISESNGRREQQPIWWIEAMVSAFSKALIQADVDPKGISAIGVSGQQHGLVALDRHGDVIRPAKLWCDTETAPQNAELLEMLGGEQACIDRLGLRIETGYTASKILWMKRHEPENFAKIAHILLPHDYLNFWLTGEFSAEYGDASGTGLFDVRNRCWDEHVCQLIDPTGNLFRALPPLNSAEKAAGVVTGTAKARLGLSDNVVVSCGGGDNMMGAIGTGNVNNGIITMSLGTSGTIYTFSDKPVELKHPSIANFCSSSNGWMPLICTMNVTSATSLVQEVLNMNLTEFNYSIEATKIGAGNISFLQFFNGERVPALPDGKASIHGLDAANFTRDNLVRSVVEGATYGLKYGLELLRDAGIQIDQIRLIGGGAKSFQWRQMIADTMNCEVICPEVEEAAALGAAIQAAWALDGELSNDLIEQVIVLNEDSRTLPISGNVGLYEVAYQRYIDTLYCQYPQLNTRRLTEANND